MQSSLDLERGWSGMGCPYTLVSELDVVQPTPDPAAYFWVAGLRLLYKCELLLLLHQLPPAVNQPGGLHVGACLTLPLTAVGVETCSRARAKAAHWLCKPCSRALQAQPSKEQLSAGAWGLE